MLIILDDNTLEFTRLHLLWISCLLLVCFLWIIAMPCIRFDVLEEYLNEEIQEICECFPNNAVVFKMLDKT